MESLLMIVLLISIIGVVYFWKKNKKNRNVSAVIALIAFIAFGMSSEGAEDLQENTSGEPEEQTSTNEADDEVVEDTSSDDLNYEILEEEFTEMGSFNRLELRVVTLDQPDTNQIEQLLNELELEVSSEYDDYDSEQDQLYIFLYENELIAEDMYSLGRLIRTEAETEVDVKQKDWNQQPSNEEYELYARFMDKSIEMNEQAMEEDSDDFVEDEEVIEAMAAEKEIEESTILESIQKVSNFIFMNVD